MSKVIYEEQTSTQIPQSMVVHRSDDAWHPLNDQNYIEWWYFDLVAIDGSLIRGQLFIAGDVSRPKRVMTGVRASYVKSDGTEVRIERRLPFSSALPLPFRPPPADHSALDAASTCYIFTTFCPSSRLPAGQAHLPRLRSSRYL